MSDVVVTVPKRLWALWLREGDLARNDGSPSTAEPAIWAQAEYGFTMGGRSPDIAPGERVYIVAHNRLRGYAPLVILEHDARRFGGAAQQWALVRRGAAVACTIPVEIRGFQGYRYRWWTRDDEIPFPDWRGRA